MNIQDDRMQGVLSVNLRISCVPFCIFRLKLHGSKGMASSGSRGVFQYNHLTVAFASETGFNSDHDA